jgi:PAS domain S-box-containing protein
MPDEKRELEGRIAALEKSAAMLQTLQQVSSIYVREGNLELALNQLLAAAIAVTHADMGNIQLYDPTTRKLKIAAQRGFGPAFLAFWNTVSEGDGACGTAYDRLQRVIIEDVTKSPIFVGTPALAVQLEAQVRAVQSTPLVSRSGVFIGMVSTHYRTARLPDEDVFPFLDLLARQAADIIERAQVEEKRQHAEQAARLLASIVESSDDAIASKDLDGVVTSWNRGAEKLFGYSPKDMIGTPIAILIPPDRPNEEPEILARIRRGESMDHYETVRRRKDGNLIHISLTVSPIRDGSGKVIGASKIARNITETKEAQARQELLTQEIHHRTRNLFAVVHSVVARSFAGKRTVQEAEAAVLDRLYSLAQTHAILMDKDGQAADLEDVIRTEMKPYSGRVAIEGPRLPLGAKAAQNFALAVHELATNAAKYGALSNASGTVQIAWNVDQPTALLTFRWKEQGGPPVAAPARKGFGSTVLEQVMAAYYDQQPKVEFDEHGLTYTLICSLDEVAPPSTTTATVPATRES